MLFYYRLVSIPVRGGEYLPESGKGEPCRQTYLHHLVDGLSRVMERARKTNAPLPLSSLLYVPSPFLGTPVLLTGQKSLETGGQGNLLIQGRLWQRVGQGKEENGSEGANKKFCTGRVTELKRWPWVREEPGVQVERLATEWEHLPFMLRTGKKAEGQGANAGSCVMWW